MAERVAVTPRLAVRVRSGEHFHGIYLDITTALKIVKEQEITRVVIVKYSCSWKFSI